MSKTKKEGKENMADQQTTLDKLLQPTFKVLLKSTQNELDCRDLPFSTLMHILRKIAEQAREEVFAERDRLVQAVAQLTAAVGSSDSNEEQLAKSLQLAWPMIARMLMESEEVSIHVLKDIVVGATDDHIKALSLVDVATIVNTTLSRIDADDLAEEIKSVFSKAVVVWNKTTASENGKAEPKENSQTSTPSSSQEVSSELVG